MYQGTIHIYRYPGRVSTPIDKLPATYFHASFHGTYCTSFLPYILSIFHQFSSHDAGLEPDLGWPLGYSDYEVFFENDKGSGHIGVKSYSKDTFVKYVFKILGRFLRIGLYSFKKVLIGSKKFSSQKLNIGIKKTHNFRLISTLLRKMQKIC